LGAAAKPRLRPLISLAVAAVSAALVAPLAGIYHGQVDGAGAHDRGEGWFMEKPTVFGKRVKPACHPDAFCKKAIIAPSILPAKGVGRGCNAEPARLGSGGFRIQMAQFHHTELAPIGPHGRRMRIHFEGRWLKRREVEGYTRIKGGGCDSGRMTWTMRTPATP
jgi:hypothetical protein